MPVGALGSVSLPHQHVYVLGSSSLGKLQPGHRHCRGGGRSPLVTLARLAAAEPSFEAHFLMQVKWNTVQQVWQDQTLELR